MIYERENRIIFEINKYKEIKETLISIFENYPLWTVKALPTSLGFKMTFNIKVSAGHYIIVSKRQNIKRY